MREQKQRLLFDHIPKTAGVTISRVLSDLFAEPYILETASNPHFLAIKTAGSRKLIAGHFWFTKDEKTSEEWYYATLIRDPIDRFLSQFYFNRTPGINTPDPQVLAAKTLTLQQYLDYPAPEIIHSYTNIQAMHFAQRMYDDPYKLTDEQLYNAACTSLTEYDCVGIYEDLLGFVNMICMDFGFSPIINLPKINVTAQPRNKKEITDNVLTRLREANGVDIRLYQWAREQFAKKNLIVSVPMRPLSIRLLPVLPVEKLSLPAPCAITNEITMPDPGNPIEFGTQEIKIESVTCFGLISGMPAMASGERCLIRLECRATIAVTDLTIGIAIRNRRGDLMYGVNSKLMDHTITIEQPGYFTAEFEFDMNLGIGEYIITLALHKGLNHLEGCYHWLDQAAVFAVVGVLDSHFEGAVRLVPKLSISIYGSPSPATSK